MNYEKYYKRQCDGTYSIHFANKKGFNDDKIKEIFTCYGNIVTLYTTGHPIFGLKYIIYQTVEEVQNCLEQLQNNAYDIQIIPQKHNMKMISQKNPSTQQYTTKKNDLSQQVCNTNKQFNWNSFRSKGHSTKEEKCTHIKENFNQENEPEYTDCTEEISSVSSRNSYKSTLETTKFDRLQSCKNYVSSKCGKANNQRKTESPLKHDVNTPVDKHIYDNSRIPALISDPEIKSKVSDTSLQCSEAIIPSLHEVIVANIHVTYGVHYILHLFEKYHPISATIIKTISESDIRYCHVYFKNIEDILAVEEEFDNFTLSGKNLIILRKSQ